METLGSNIIGRKDIFERFKICFDESKRVVEFHQKDNPRDQQK